ncbi:hypothetical protein VNI00_008764 [Paramarasmius palmivorus]|uniref:Glucose-methanol-choline oxidoreductase N-terminal domain-containing protein n=1 Tax=Paramarasmius palmivorus TaxID=297713 RepID=A0AAW0CT99_9AGAR
MFPRALLVSLLSAAVVLTQQTSDSYDYVIVGGGTAGLTVAARLTENTNVKVAVLEAGGTGIGNANITDLRNRYLPYGTLVDWVLPTLPQSSAGGRVYTHTQGKVLGGSSAINGAVYLRPDTREFAAYEALGAKGWSWDKFLSYFKRSETFSMDGDTFGLDVNASYHGTDGPVQVSFAHNVSSFFSDYALPTAKNLGLALNGDNSDGSQVGVAPQQISVYDGSYNRSYAANAYYFPNQGRSNLVVHTDSLVSRIIWGEDEDGLAVATGVEYISTNGTSTLNAKTVIVSAGTLNTPKVLELSGVGDASILSSLGIDLKVNNTGVGKNLQNQLGVNVVFKLKDGSVTAGTETQAPVIALLPAQNILTPEDLAKSDEILATPNKDISQSQFDALKKYIADGIAQTEMNWSLQKGTNGSTTLQFYTTDLHTFSRGHVHANSTDPTAKPTVDPQYLSSEHDLWYLSKAILFARNITAAEPLKSIIECTTPESVQEWLLPNFKTMSHFVGTAAALPQEDGGVVDPETLIVYGTSNVRVVDNSVVPLLPGIHTESFAYAIGEWAADILRF